MSIPAATALLLTSPLSPGAIGFGDVLVGFGEPTLAVSHYDRVARSHPLAGVRRQALRRAALIQATELGAPAESEARLVALDATVEDPDERAELWSTIGALREQAGDLDRAAQAWRVAHDVDPAGGLAAEALVHRAEAFTALHRVDEALDAWVEVERLHPERGAQARLARAQVHLSAGELHQALDLFEDAAETGSSRDLVAIAQLGRATCLERMGHIDEAVVQLDGSDLPSGVRSPRQRSLRGRRPPRPRGGR